MNNYILYQAYGNMDVVNECKFSLLRLLSVYGSNNKPHVIIYSDKPGEFIPFKNEIPLTIEIIHNKDINAWRGSINFVHRVKIEVIRDCLDKYPGKVIYADTDTCCIKDLNGIFDTISGLNVFFHTNEGSLSQPQQLHQKKWKRFLMGSDIDSFKNFSPLQINMWNAGVIGLQQSHSSLLGQVLELTDMLYPSFGKHTVEQFAFCYIFQKENKQFNSAEPYFFHYWNLKEFRKLLGNFFIKYKEADLKTLVKLSENIFPEKILQDKMEFENSPKLSKFIKHFTGKEWDIDKYEV